MYVYYSYAYMYSYALGHFNRALDIMNRAVSGTYQPGIKENMAYFTTTEKRYICIYNNYATLIQ